MIRLFQTRRGKLWAMAALAAICLASSLPAQQEPDIKQFVALDAKTVSKLQLTAGAPDYPGIAKLNYIHGEVRIRIFVSREGRVIKMHAVQGHPFLVVAAMQAIKDWTYMPYRIGKQTWGFTTLISVHFNLHPKMLSDMPPTAERDLEARVSPPKVAEQPDDPPSENRIQLRVLIDSKGHALDVQRISGNESDGQEAERELSQWKFQPAHWGNMPVPWYVDVEVPVPHSPA